MPAMTLRKRFRAAACMPSWAVTSDRTNEKIDRLSELGISYVCLREEGFQKARAQQIGDIHKFVLVLSNSAAASDLCGELGLKPSYVAPLLASFNDSPYFVRLREVKEAMLPEPSAQSRTPVLVDSVGRVEPTLSAAA